MTLHERCFAENIAKRDYGGFNAPQFDTCGACYLAIDSGTSIALNGKQYHQRCYAWYAATFAARPTPACRRLASRLVSHGD